MALTADEEGRGPYNGVDRLLKNKRELIESEYALNEGGRGQMIDGKRVSNEISLSEKTYSDFRLEVRNKGGHSARPVPDNAIYHLAGALYRLSTFTFPFQLNEELAKVAEGSEEAMHNVATASASMNAMMRTTCVATQLEAGHATNALPQLAAANVNCRVLPEDSVENVLEALKKVVADDQDAFLFWREFHSQRSAIDMRA